MRMLEKMLTRLLCPVFLLSVDISCTTEPAEQPVHNNEEVVIIATATLPDDRSKMIYEDHYPGTDGIKTGWVTGDTFLALEINGETVTPVTFTATASADIKTSFVSSGAVAASSTTTWVAVLGKGAAFADGNISCSYDGQDGSLKGLEKCDYMMAASTGESPDFNYGDGKHLTYLLRIKMPEGVGQIEFNTWSQGAEWIVSSDGSLQACVPDYRPKATKLLPLKQETTAGKIVYLAVPAVDYSDAGLIVTAQNQAGTKSQGKVLSANFSAKGGKAATLEMGSLIDRPLPADAVNFVAQLGSTLSFISNTSWDALNDQYTFSCSPSWAPFNVGAKASPVTAEEAYGSYFAWGETEQRESYSHDSYRYDGKDAELGYIRSHSGRKDIRLNLHVISGTKYDVARVKWGSAWRMPFLEEMMSFLGSNESFTCTSGRATSTDNLFRTVDVSVYNGVAVNGRTFSRNGQTLFFPFAGRYFYTSGGQASTPSMVGKAGFYFGGVHSISSGRSEAYRFYVRNAQVDLLAEGCEYAFTVRPVLAQDTDEHPIVTASGRVTASDTGQGIAGVIISDGYSCCTTDADGAYSMQANPAARYITVTVPSFCEIPLGPDGRPAFYKRVDLTGRTEVEADFSLTPRKESVNRFTLITVADAHVQNSTHLARFTEGPFADIQQTVNKLGTSGGPIIGIALGDQLTDNMAMASSVREIYTGVKTSSGTLPFFYVIGNHDHESIENGTDDQSTAFFLDNFGPTDYSFDVGNAHIIVVDDIDFNGKTEGGSGGYNHIKYREGLTGEKLHWLREDIALVKDKASKVVLLCTHAPLSNCMNADEAKLELRAFNEAHIYSGHLHNLKNHTYSTYKTRNGHPIIDHGLQSLSGQIWRADVSANGSPAGYSVHTYDGAGLYWGYNKTWKEGEDFQIRVYSGNDSYSGYKWDSSYSGKFLARVWDGDDPETAAGEETWTLTFTHDGKTVPMTRVKNAIIDQCGDSYYYEVLHAPFGNWVRLSYTWWEIDAPGGDPAAVTDWKITATHKMPGKEKSYSESILTRDYTGYALDSHFIWSGAVPEPVPDPESGNPSTAPSLNEENENSFINN